MDGERISTEPRDKPAVIMGGTGEVTTFGQFDARSSQAAHLFRSLGLTHGDAVAFCLENSSELLEIAWGCLRSGLIVVPVSSKLTAGEIAYIVRDSGAKLLIASAKLGAETFAAIPDEVTGVTLFTVGAAAPGYRSWTDEAADQPVTPVADERFGANMLYSSGTTGRPKGIRWEEVVDPADPSSALRSPEKFGLTDQTIYLSPAPLYHSAPFVWTLAVIRCGGTAVVMEKFDPEQALALIERHRITFSQWVPTHFVRMLKLPEDVRRRYDTSSLKLAVHAAAPCPVSVKHEMIAWWGPILLEYFGSTEQTAMTIINSEEWLRKPGSVGKCMLGSIRVCDENGDEVPAGTIGTIYSENGKRFLYHNDPEKTAQSRNQHGWSTVGDVGYVDEDGYVFLTDRKNFMIITGGVNVYPQEIENLLVTHPQVADAAVIGVPDLEMGEIVTAVIQPMDMADATPAFAEELRVWMRRSLSGVKVPKRILFEAELPRLPTGKMQKFALRERILSA